MQELEGVWKVNLYNIVPTKHRYDIEICNYNTHIKVSTLQADINNPRKFMCKREMIDMKRR